MDSKAINEMIFEGYEEGYKVYKNANGFMEGYKSTGRFIENGTVKYKSISRVVSNQTTLSGFGAYIRGLRKQTPLKDKPIPPPSLPFTEL